MNEWMKFMCAVCTFLDRPKRETEMSDWLEECRRDWETMRTSKLYSHYSQEVSEFFKAEDISVGQILGVSS